jgi:chemotaxis-related protein WspD
MPDRPALNDCWNKIGVWGDGGCPELERHVHCRNCPVYSAAAAQLLDAEMPPGYLDEWTQHLSREKPRQSIETNSVVIFRIGMEWLALPTSVFSEIAPLKAIHSLPHQRNGVVLGIVNIRGELLVCVSLGEALGLAKVTDEEAGKTVTAQRRLLVVKREGSRLVFPADEIHGIHRFSNDDVRPVPATVSRATATYTRGMLLWKDKSVGCLDDQLLFYTLNRGLA